MHSIFKDGTVIPIGVLETAGGGVGKVGAQHKAGIDETAAASVIEMPLVALAFRAAASFSSI